MNAYQVLKLFSTKPFGYICHIAQARNFENENLPFIVHCYGFDEALPLVWKDPYNIVKLGGAYRSPIYSMNKNTEC